MQQYQATHFCSAATFRNIFRFMLRYRKFVTILGTHSPEFPQYFIDGAVIFSNKDKSSVEQSLYSLSKASLVC